MGLVPYWEVGGVIGELLIENEVFSFDLFDGGEPVDAVVEEDSTLQLSLEPSDLIGGDDINRFLVPPLNIAFTSSHA